MNAKPGSSPVSRLRGLNKSVGGLVRPKLRRVHTANTEKELLKTVDGAAFAGMADDFNLRQTTHFQEESRCISTVNVPSFKLRASTRQGFDGKGSALSRGAETETVDKQTSFNKESQNCGLDYRDFKTRVIHSRIRELIRQILLSHLDKWEFNPVICGEKCRKISKAIENDVKLLFSARYKITALVYIGAIRDRGIELSSQCVWNPSTDSFSMATFTNDSQTHRCIQISSVHEKPQERTLTY